METTVEKVYVQELWSDGSITTKPYSIRDSKGMLMIERLRKFASSNKSQLGSGTKYDTHGDGYDNDHIFSRYRISYLGISWKRSLALVEEITKDRAALQEELFKLEGESELTRYIAPLPSDASDPVISAAVLAELNLRRDIKRRIRKLDRAKEAQNIKLGQAVSAPYTW